MSKKSERLAQQAETWRIVTRAKILEYESYVTEDDGSGDTAIMWQCAKETEEMLVPSYLGLLGWPLEKRLPRGASKQALGSVLRNAVSAWVMDDTDQVTWKHADRPALYLSIVQLLQMTSYQERTAILKQAMQWATAEETYCICDSEVLEALALGMQEEIRRAAERIEKAIRKIAREEAKDIRAAKKAAEEEKAKAEAQAPVVSDDSDDGIDYSELEAA